MLNGIGGRTIAEAQHRMSAREVGIWMAFREKYGSLHMGRRVEQAQATTSAILANANSEKGGHTVYDFMPHEEEPELTLEEAMAQWT